MYMKMEQPTDTVLRCERFEEELQHTAYYLGRPVGRRHKQAALRGQDLSERMRDDDLFEVKQQAGHAEGERVRGCATMISSKLNSKARTSFLEAIENLIDSYHASADMAAMGWRGICRVAFGAFSPIGWAEDKARSQVSPIVNCLIDNSFVDGVVACGLDECDPGCHTTVSRRSSSSETLPRCASFARALTRYGLLLTHACSPER